MNVWTESLLNLVYPEPPLEGELTPVREPFCFLCGEPFSGELNPESICTNCRNRRWFLRKARAAYRAEGAVREVIHKFKYEQQFHFLRKLTGWLIEGYARFYENEKERPDALVPVPLYRLRHRERGFNQAQELARTLARHARLPVCDALERVKATRVQASLRRSERLRNQQGAFALKRGFDVAGRKLLIIDDVFTTGATINACAQVLRKSGASRVDALTVARG